MKNSRGLQVVLLFLCGVLFMTVLGTGQALAQKLYWTSRTEDDSIWLRCGELDGSDVINLVTASGPEEVAVGNGKLYWTSAGSGIYSADLDGSDVELLLDESSLGDLEYDPLEDRLYFMYYNTIRRSRGIWRMDSDGQNVELVLETDGASIALDPVARVVYWVRPGVGYDIWQVDFDRKKPQLVINVRQAAGGLGLAVDYLEKKLYWAKVTYNGIQVIERSNVDGSGEETLVSINSGLDDWPTYVDIDLVEKKVYWANGEDADIYWADLDGSDAERLRSVGVQGPYGFAVHNPLDLVPPPPPEFLRGDCDGNGSASGNVNDAIASLRYNFVAGSPEPPCLAACDADGNGTAIGQVNDAIYMLTFSFRGGPAPVVPFPACGPGTPADAAIGCATPPACGVER